MILRRLFVAIPVLVISSFVMFVMVSLSGNPLARFLNSNPPPDAETIRLLELEYGVHGSLLERYWAWITGVFRLDFGRSTQGLQIGQSIWNSFGTTLVLIVGAILVAAVFAVVIGVVSGVRQLSAVDTTLSALVLVALATPTFWLAILLKNGGVSVNAGLGVRLFYTVGDGAGQGFPVRLGFLILPVLVLVVNIFAAWCRYIRASVIDVMSMDFVDLARAKGLSEWRVVRKHVLRNALIPFVTVAALDFGSLVGGAVVTETVFQWRGMGDLLLNGIQNTDTNLVMAWMLIFATATIALNLLADVLYGLLDPRVRR
ncbi:ABC transporter permease [Saccharopolyspora shandongensis]|uniref:ABC transporter permease n=1 Tax=Saccharopolyspora shandongensis TaxID=418495 RepID=UPI0033E90718